MIVIERKKEMKKILFTMSVVLVLLIANITLVSASQPSVESYFWKGQDTFDCGDFTILDDWEGNYKYTYYWNEDGTLDRYHVRSDIYDIFTNPINGKSISGRAAGYNFFEDVEDEPGVWVHAGTMYHAVLPGAGTVLIDAGYMIFIPADGQITVLRGNHDVNGGDIDQLCAALR
jgi:hypothetical protein